MKMPGYVPSLEEITEEYNKRYRENPNKWSQPDRDIFMRDIITKMDAPESLIDVGCGNGHSLEFIDKLFPDTRLFGIDLSVVALEQMIEKVPRAIPIHDSIETIAGKMSFSASICLGTAEHFIDLKEGLKALRWITKDYCYMELPNNLSYSPGEYTLRKLTIGSQQWEWHLTREMWEDLFKEAGFSILESHTGNHVVWEFVWVLV